MLFEALGIASLLLAMIPAFLFVANLRIFRPAPVPRRAAAEPVSVLIPARNEEQNIAGAVESALAAGAGQECEVVVLDDGSNDATAAVVQRIAVRDPRVRLLPGPPLPPGWCGKQHACHVLAEHATYDWLCFVDADVRLAPGALTRMTAFANQARAALVSGFPRQLTGSITERLLIPLIHFVLLGFLPLARMRASTAPAYAAGCGQLMMARRQEYRTAGGHRSIRSSLHDGIQLPRQFRIAGFRTDIFDATDLAACRMYTSAAAVWSGLAKNATEGMASPGRLPLFTVLLLGGQVLPFLLLASPAAAAFAAPAAFLALVPRVLAARRFRQPVLTVILHPIAVVLLLVIQWYALARHLLGRPSAWRGRSYSASAR